MPTWRMKIALHRFASATTLSRCSLGASYGLSTGMRRGSGLSLLPVSAASSA
jgi:hypothetical protein